jgi:uncharacterized membrane protein
MGKAKRPSAAFYLLAATTSGVALTPFALFAETPWGGLPARFWRLVLASGVFETLYMYGLYQGYRRGDISLVYPLARALPVLLTAAITLGLGLGATPAPLALLGMGVVAAGCLLLPLARPADLRLKTYATPAIRMILLAAAGTTGYTIIDSLALPHLHAVGASSRLVCAGMYLFLIEWATALGMGICVLANADERAELRRLFLRSPFPPLSGLFSSSAYLLVLVAMGFVANVSYIQAFRQMSLPLGVFAGILLLKESRAPLKLAGVALVVAGLVLVALGR